MSAPQGLGMWIAYHAMALARWGGPRTRPDVAAIESIADAAVEAYQRRPSEG